MPDDIQIFADAGLTPADVADLLNLSRVTVSRWFNHHTEPHALLRRRVDDLLARIKNCLDTRELPLASAAKSSTRYATLRSILYGDEPAPGERL
jgi:transcriptional regulator with XRE-family HTH domain